MFEKKHSTARRLFLLVVLSLSWITISTTQVHFESSTYKQALAKASRLNKLVFIYFYTDWCKPCKEVPKVVFVDSLIRFTIASRYVSLKRNAEKGEGLTLSKRYNVGGFPTFLFLDTSGKELGRVMGTRSNKDYLELFRSAGSLDPLR